LMIIFFVHDLASELCLLFVTVSSFNCWSRPPRSEQDA
jgi:hypothetical protein